MSNGGKGETFRIPSLPRAYPPAQHAGHYHYQTYDHGDGRVESVMTIDYRIRSPSPVSVLSDTSEEIGIEVEPVEVVTISSPVRHPSHLLHYERSEPIIITPKPLRLPALTYEPHGVVHRPPIYQVVERTPSKAMIVHAMSHPEKTFVQEKPPYKCRCKPSTWINLLIAALALFVAIAMAVMIALAVMLSKRSDPLSFQSVSSMSSACSANCMMEITPFSQATVAFWRFDGSTADLNNIYPGLYTNPPTVPYLDGNYGQAVNLSGSQYVYSSSQFMNLTYRSWTIEAWLLATDLTVDRGIFGQCESASLTDRCLSLSIRGRRLYLDFGTTVLRGTSYLSQSSVLWHHVAFVYDYTTMRQFIYWDGNLEASTGPSGIGVGPYKGNSGQVTIGWVNGNKYFLGRIDHVSVTSSAKTACQILNDATLTAYYPFDTTGSYLDYSMNILHGVTNSLITLTGRVNQGYSFQNTLSYFQSSGFTAYSAAEPFTVSLWIKPYYVNGGTLLHLSTGISGSSSACFDLLGFTSSGQIIGQLLKDTAACCVSGQQTANAAGSIIPVNIWTHVALTYNSDNGLALYLNGSLVNVTAPFDSFPSSSGDFTVRPYLTVGNPKTTGSNPTCVGGLPSLSPGAYQGIIDELRIYNRPLSNAEICSLYHV